MTKGNHNKFELTIHVEDLTMNTANPFFQLSTTPITYTISIAVSLEIGFKGLTYVISNLLKLVILLFHEIIGQLSTQGIPMS